MYGLVPRKLETSSDLYSQLQQYTMLSPAEQANLQSDYLSYIYTPSSARKIIYFMISVAISQYYSDYKPELQANFASAIFGGESGLYIMRAISNFFGSDYIPTALEESIYAGIGGYLAYERIAGHASRLLGEDGSKKLFTTYNAYSALTYIIPLLQKIYSSRNFDIQKVAT